MTQCLHWFVPGAHWLGPLAAAKGKETKKVTSRFHFEVKFYDAVKQYLVNK